MRISRWGMVAAFLLPVLALVPFADKGWHIDDPAFLWVGQAIERNPIRYFDAHIDLGGWEAPMPLVNHNPPGLSYYFALTAAVFGWGEIPIHLALALLGGVYGLAVYLLAARLGARPMLAVALAVFTPGYLTSASTAMTDAPMTAFYVAAIYLWVTGLDRRSRGRMAAAGLLIFAATFTKYYGLTLFPLLGAYTILRTRRSTRISRRLSATTTALSSTSDLEVSQHADAKKPSKDHRLSNRFRHLAKKFVELSGLDIRLLYFLFPIVLLALFQWWGYALYGTLPLGDASETAKDGMFRKNETALFRFFHIPVFTGGCIASIALVAPLFLRLRVWLPVAGFLLIMALPVIDGYCPLQLALERSDPWTANVWITAAAFATAGYLVYAAVVRYAWRNRTPEGALIAMWVFGTAVFALYINHFINARVLLPIIPAAAIAASSQLGEVWAKRGERAARRLVGVPVAAAVVLAFWVTAADYYSSTYHRDAAVEVHAIAQREGTTLRFSATWGFQYYLEEYGYRRLGVFENPETGFYQPIIRNGDLFATSPSGTDMWDKGGAPREFELVERLEYPNFLGVVCHQAGYPAGFYAHRLGMLPYYFGAIPNSAYQVFRWIGEDSLPPEGSEVFRDSADEE